MKIKYTHDLSKSRIQLNLQQDFESRETLSLRYFMDYNLLME
jgi:hypothetical protein